MLAANCDGLYNLEEVNIETDPVLKERYGLLIPVVSINGIAAFKYRMTASAFRESLNKARKSAVS